MKILKLSLYRFDPEKTIDLTCQTTQSKWKVTNMMVIDAIRKAQEKDPTITFRRSCAQGVCGSDGVNMNGQNGLACITSVSSVAVANRLEVRPLPGLPVIKDLIVDMKPFYDQYEKIKPFLDNDEEINTGQLEKVTKSRRKKKARWFI